MIFHRKSDPPPALTALTLPTLSCHPGQERRALHSAVPVSSGPRLRTGTKCMHFASREQFKRLITALRIVAASGGGAPRNLLGWWTCSIPWLGCGLDTGRHLSFVKAPRPAHGRSAHATVWSARSTLIFKEKRKTGSPAPSLKEGMLSLKEIGVNKNFKKTKVVLQVSCRSSLPPSALGSSVDLYCPQNQVQVPFSWPWKHWFVWGRGMSGNHMVDSCRQFLEPAQVW